MRVFILGGTGSIGAAIVRELRARSHDVDALSRSNISDDRIRRLGAVPRRGDMRQPEAWMRMALESDAIIHVAATFTEDMGHVDSGVVLALLSEATAMRRKPRVLYTGGCWLYGATGDEVATEERPFDPLPEFSWMVENAGRLLASPNLSVAVIHPGMVYDRYGGVLARYVKAAREGGSIEIWGSPDTRWPLAHSSDVARAYCDLLVRPGLTGHFNVASQEDVRVGDIATVACEAFGGDQVPLVLTSEELISVYGRLAIGPTLDQQMSAIKLRSATGWTPNVTDYRRSDFLEYERK